MKFEVEKYSLLSKPTKSGEASFFLNAELPDKSMALMYSSRLIYIVKDGERFLYVGEAKAELKTRLQRGFVSYRYFKRKGKARNGYKGYKWIKLLDSEDKSVKGKLDLYAILFSSKYDENREVIEAVEGDLVFEIKRRTGSWPLFQNEIHFNNENKMAHETAIKIIEMIS